MTPALRKTLAGLTLAGEISGAAHAASMDAVTAAFADCPRASENQLDGMRGGFQMPQIGTIAPLDIAFGFERSVYVNGQLVVSQTLNIPSVGAVVSQGANAVAAFGSTLTVVQNGPGNTFTPPTTLPTGTLTLVQNSLDNQVIQAVNTLNATVTSLSLLRSFSLQGSLTRGLVNSIR